MRKGEEGKAIQNFNESFSNSEYGMFIKSSVRTSMLMVFSSEGQDYTINIMTFHGANLFGLLLVNTTSCVIREINRRIYGG